jgi:spermidine/putrescine transport system permease protein
VSHNGSRRRDTTGYQRFMKRNSTPYLLSFPTWLVMGIFFAVPIAIMLWISFQQRSMYGGIKPIADYWSYFSSAQFTQNYIRSFEWIYLQILGRSFWIAIFTTVVCLLVSYPMAYYIALKAHTRFKDLLLVLVVIPFWTSFLIRTYAWMFILRNEGFLNNFLIHLGVIQSPLPLLYNEFAVMIGLVYGEIPFMVLPIYASLEKLDRSLLEASSDLGASRASTFWRITVPLSFSGILAGCILVFIPSLGQFIVPDLLGGAKDMLVGNLVQNQFSVARNKPFGSAIAFELTAIVLVLLFFYARYIKRKGEESLL